MNMKGGVGKTTVTGNLGTAFAHRAMQGKGRKVLLIDYDPQFNLSQGFLKSATYFALEAKKHTSLAILQDDATTLDPFTIQLPTKQSPPAVSTLAHRLKSYSNACLDLV